MQVNTVSGALRPPQKQGKGEDDILIAATTLFKAGKIIDARQQLMQYIALYTTRIEDTYRWMYDNLDLFGASNEQRDANIIVIRNGLANLPLVGIPEISLAATLVELTS